ncbi:MAG: S-methyl-5-thioribose-1-phosphate isomerase [Firmicutes bacterium]|nr:S-methyl-5-thioribose-1-phosphate isomerase [Bacillota bacterium]
MTQAIRPLVFNGDRLTMIDQTRLPQELIYLDLRTVEEVWEAIRSLRVRGAPAIGLAASFGYALAAAVAPVTDSLEGFVAHMQGVREYLETSRPTAVNLFWAMARMDRVLREETRRLMAAQMPDARSPTSPTSPTSPASAQAMTQQAIVERLRAEAVLIQSEDERSCRAIGENLLTLMTDGMGVLTHCNTGTLATSQYGTALAGFYLAHERGWAIRVFADETRPVLQGARLTAWELQQAGIDVTLICDNMAATVMAQGNVQAVVVGADRIAANGDTANKIGTHGLAVLARHFGVPFYVAAPVSTMDPATATGADIHIEERAAKEVTHVAGERIAPEGVSVYNPAFDVTPHELITAIVTERGICRPDFAMAIGNLTR